MYKVCNVKVRFKLNCSASVLLPRTLSPPQRPLCIVGRLLLWGGWGERKRERAGHDAKGEERRYFDGDTQREPLRRRESRTRKRASSSSLYVRHTCLFRLCLSVITLCLSGLRTVCVRIKDLYCSLRCYCYSD